MLGRVILTRRLSAELLSILERSSCEVCGGLYGILRGEALCLSHLLLCPNRSQSVSEFAIDIEDIRVAPSGSQHRLVGLFHSHPHGEPTASAYDLLFLRRSQMVWAIIGRSRSTLAPEVKFFVHVNGMTKEIEHLVEQ